MSTLVSFRMPPELRRSVERIAKRRKCAASVVMREAVETFVKKEETAPTPYELSKDLIGSVKGGDPKLSENMGRKFTELLRARRARA